MTTVMRIALLMLAVAGLGIGVAIWDKPHAPYVHISGGAICLVGGGTAVTYAMVESPSKILAAALGIVGMAWALTGVALVTRATGRERRG